MKLARLSKLQRLGGGRPQSSFFLRLLGERSGGQRRGPSSWRAPLLILFSRLIFAAIGRHRFISSEYEFSRYFTRRLGPRWIDLTTQNWSAGRTRRYDGTSRSVMDARGRDKRSVPKKKGGGGVVFTPLASVIFDSRTPLDKFLVWKFRCGRDDDDIVFQQRVLHNACVA